MAACFVYICQEVVDRSELETYWSKIGPTLERYGARSVAATHLSNNWKATP